MSASRAFIDVLVGKLTAYVDVPSRPAPSISTPYWVRTLETQPITPLAASRAYAVHAAAGPARTPIDDLGQAHRRDAGARSRPQTTEAHRAGATHMHVPVFSRADAAGRATAIQLLQRLGATSLGVHSSDAEIKSACRQLMRTFHPDAHPAAKDADRSILTARLRAVIVARDILDARPGVGSVAA